MLASRGSAGKVLDSLASADDAPRRQAGWPNVTFSLTATRAVLSSRAPRKRSDENARGASGASKSLATASPATAPRALSSQVAPVADRAWHESSPLPKRMACRFFSARFSSAKHGAIMHAISINSAWIEIACDIFGVECVR
jgi:hypothetical protein